MNANAKRPRRQQILAELKPALSERDIVIAALAGTTADCYQVIDRPGNLYLVGMGMVSQVAFGLARALPRWRIFALDTDGSMLLAPSILPVIGTYRPPNLYVLVFDNEQLFGTRGGPQSQTASGTDIAGLAKSCGLEQVRTLTEESALHSEMSGFLAARGPSLLVAKIEMSVRGAGPKIDGLENKYQLIRHVEKVEGIQILAAAKP